MKPSSSLILLGAMAISFASLYALLGPPALQHQGPWSHRACSQTTVATEPGKKFIQNSHNLVNPPIKNK